MRQSETVRRLIDLNWIDIHVKFGGFVKEKSVMYSIRLLHFALFEIRRDMLWLQTCNSTKKCIVDPYIRMDFVVLFHQEI